MVAKFLQKGIPEHLEKASNTVQCLIFGVFSTKDFAAATKWLQGKALGSISQYVYTLSFSVIVNSIIATIKTSCA
jgi:hypothetical protein